MKEPLLIFERSQPGRRGTCVRARNDIASHERQLPGKLTRGQSLPLPEVDETTLVRHYVKLSQINYGVDTGFYVVEQFARICPVFHLDHDGTHTLG